MANTNGETGKKYLIKINRIPYSNYAKYFGKNNVIFVNYFKISAKKIPNGPNCYKSTEKFLNEEKIKIFCKTFENILYLKLFV